MTNSERIQANNAKLRDSIETAKTLPEAGAGDPVIESLEVTKNGTYTAPDGVDGYSPVTVNVPVPDGYLVPSGILEITENGTYDVTEKASVVVDVVTSIPDPREDYQRVEYITSAVEGTYPYIITDVCADNDTGAEVVASFPALQDRIPMGSRENSDATRFYVVYPLSANSIYYGFNTGSTISCQLKVDTIYRLQTNFMNCRLVNVYDANGIRKGGGSISETLTPHSVPMAIFGYNSASSGLVSSKREYKLYGARISRKNEVIRDYYPCYRRLDGVVGLYEKITGQFLTNADTGGDSAFTTGAEIEW